MRARPDFAKRPSIDVKTGVLPRRGGTRSAWGTARIRENSECVKILRILTNSATEMLRGVAFQGWHVPARWGKEWPCARSFRMNEFLHDMRTTGRGDDECSRRRGRAGCGRVHLRGSSQDVAASRMIGRFYQHRQRDACRTGQFTTFPTFFPAFFPGAVQSPLIVALCLQTLVVHHPILPFWPRSLRPRIVSSRKLYFVNSTVCTSMESETSMPCSGCSSARSGALSSRLPEDRRCRCWKLGRSPSG
jgi:hypothetical protein